MDLEGALEAAEILKRAKTDANSYETEKHQATVAVVNTAKSKCDLTVREVKKITVLGYEIEYGRIVNQEFHHLKNYVPTFAKIQKTQLQKC